MMDKLSETPPQTATKFERADNTRWTGAKAAAFLRALGDHGKVTPAARSVGMSRQSAYRLRSRAPQFSQLWDMAMAQARRSKAERRRESSGVHPLLSKRPLPPCRDQQMGAQPQ